MSISAAIEAIRSEHARASLRRQRRREHETVLRSLQDLVEDVERRNVASDREISDDLWRRVEWLAQQAPVEPPRDLWRARLTSGLHDALLRWEGVMLDRLAPHRVVFADRYD